MGSVMNKGCNYPFQKSDLPVYNIVDNISVLPKTRVNVYWEGGVRVEPDTTSKLLALPCFLSKKKISILDKFKYAGRTL